MELILPYPIKPLDAQISHSDKILMVGSCFSENIGTRLQENKWALAMNPTGNLYNPISIFKTIGGKLNQEAVVEKNGLYSNWDVHGDLTYSAREELVSEIEAKNTLLSEWAKKANWIVVTLGTAFVYELVDSGELVANCHKVPQNRFRKRLLTEAEILESFKNVSNVVRLVNPDAKWLFTVSPVKHLKDGLTENHISKGVLLKAISEIRKNHANVHYFPAYELVTDVLRDYRFFEKDFAHPNELSIQYIWERFLESVVSEEGKKFILRWKHIKQALQHRPLHPESKEHQMFIKHMITDLQAFGSEVDITSELAHFKRQLIG